MIACAKCQSPIHLHPKFVLRFPLQTPRLCYDCALLFDHCNEPAMEEAPSHGG
jgi:hypothetical protein